MRDRARPAAAETREKEESTSSSEAQFERLFLQEYPRIIRLLVRLVGDQAEAEDLALETFWRLHENPPDPHRSWNPGGWLARVAANLGLNALRARKRRSHYETAAGQNDLEKNSGEDPVEMYAAEEERAKVRQVLAGMDERQAQLLLMRYSDLSYAEMATALGVSPNSIGTLLVRAQREFEQRYRAS